MTIPARIQKTRSEKGALFLRFLSKFGYYDRFIEHVKMSIERCPGVKEKRIFEEFLVDGILRYNIFDELLGFMWLNDPEYMSEMYNRWSNIYKTYRLSGLKFAIEHLKN